MIRKVLAVLLLVVLSVSVVTEAQAAKKKSKVPVIREKQPVITVAEDPQTPAYVIDNGSTYRALRDHFMLVNLNADVTLGLAMKAGTTFSTQEMYRLSRGFDVCTRAQYDAALLQRSAMGDNAATIIVAQVNSDIKEIREDQRKAQEWKHRNPAFLEAVLRSLDRHARDSADDLLRGAGWRAVRDILDNM